MQVKAIQFAESIAMKPLMQAMRDKIRLRSPLIVADEAGYAAIFPYGVVILWQRDESSQQRFLDEVRPFAGSVLERPIIEEVEVVEDAAENTVSDDRIHVKTVDPDTVSIVSLVLSRSVVLDRHEIAFAPLMDRLGSAVSQLRFRRQAGLRSRQLLGIASEAMHVHYTTSNVVPLLDTPDIAWEDAEMYGFYQKLLAEYELEYRSRLLNHNLRTTVEHSEFILQYVESRKSFWLEVTIIALIAFEIVIFLYDLWGS